MSEETPAKTDAQAPNGHPAARKKWMIVLAVLFVIAGVAYGLHWYIQGQHYASSDDAYVSANIVQITPQVGGTVVAIAANETDYVHAGEVLIKLDSTNARIALEEAEAQLAQTVREVRTLYSNNNGLTAALAQHRAQLAQARAGLAQAQADLARRKNLSGTGAVSQEEVAHAQTAVEDARSNVASVSATLNTAQSQLVSNQALTSGTAIRQHPRVLAAAVKVQQAYLDLQRGNILSPVGGYVGKRNVQLGQRVAIGAPLMTIVPLGQIWVDANYKETQLRHIRIGQPVSLTADIYGGNVDYHGRVAGIGSGTGAAFALLPAQNATGNWIKVVQRVPVRISLEPNEVAAHPLRVGMSVTAVVDLEHNGPVLASASSTGDMTQTQVYNGTSHAVDALIDKIISNNMGERPTPDMKN